MYIAIALVKLWWKLNTVTYTFPLQPQAIFPDKPSPIPDYQNKIILKSPIYYWTETFGQFQSWNMIWPDQYSGHNQSSIQSHSQHCADWVYGFGKQNWPFHRAAKCHGSRAYIHVKNPKTNFNCGKSWFQCLLPEKFSVWKIITLATWLCIYLMYDLIWSEIWYICIDYLVSHAGDLVEQEEAWRKGKTRRGNKRKAIWGGCLKGRKTKYENRKINEK